MDTEPLSKPMADLTSKVGPLPAWVWGVGVIGGYLLYTHFYAATPLTPDNTNDPLVDAADAGDTTDTTGLIDPVTGLPYDPSSADYRFGDTLGGSYGGSIGSTTQGGVVTSYVTNQQWAIAAINALRTDGFSASDATTAITLYLAHKPLTGNQVLLVNAAESLIGPPPLPLPIVEPAPNPLPPPPAKHPGKKTEKPPVSWEPIPWPKDKGKGKGKGNGKGKDTHKHKPHPPHVWGY